MSFLGEIKRRKVFQVAVVYSVVAWLTIQIVDVVSEPLNLPDWLDTVVIVLLAAGFPIAIVLAWAFDLTPQGIKAASDVQDGSVDPQSAGQRLSNISQGLVLLAVGFLVVDQYVLEPQTRTADGGSFITRPLEGVSRSTIPIPSERGLDRGLNPSTAISPDGRQIVFVAESADGLSQLYLRPLEQFEAEPMPGTEDAVLPFFSPDGRWVGFLANGVLWKVGVKGGAPVKISDVPIGYRGASWGSNDIIILGGNNTGLAQVSANGGTLPTAITSIDIDRNEDYHAWPDLLPGGKDVLFTIHGTAAEADSSIGILSLETGRWEVLEGTQGGMQPKYVDTGHIVYARGGSLFAMGFDASNMTPTSVSAPALDRVHTRFNAGLSLSDFDVSQSGTLVYVSAITSQSEIVLMDRHGGQVSLTSEKGLYHFGVDLAADGERMAFTYNAGLGSSDIWIQNLSTHIRARLTTDGANIYPVWTPDSSHIIFASFKSGSFNLYSKPADRSTDAVPLLTREYGQIPMSLSPDGKTLLFWEEHPATGYDIWVLDLDVSKPTPVVVTRFNERSPVFSPDGNWLAYASDESGRYEIVVQPYPGPGPRIPISSEGGEYPVWSPKDGELFYVTDDSLMGVEIETDPVFKPGTPRVIFELPDVLEGYDVTPDAEQFVMVTGNREALVELNLVLGWAEELQRLAPPSE